MPGGGDCEGRTAAIAPTRETALSLGGNTCVAAICVVPENVAVTTAGGTCGLAVQQLALAGAHGILICWQQLCDACCAGSTHVPTGNSSTPIRATATAVRWLIPRNIRSAYHVRNSRCDIHHRMRGVKNCSAGEMSNGKSDQHILHT